MSDTADRGPGLDSALGRSVELERLLAFARHSIVPHGFGWLDDLGQVVPEQGLQIWINARMTYVFSLAALRDCDPEAMAHAEHGVRALTSTFADRRDGGWVHTVSFDGDTVIDDAKYCYDHAFVLLAACAAQQAGVSGAAELLADALAIHERYFFDDDAGACREQWSRDWTRLEPYRGANSNMHTVEAYLVAADTTGEARWRDRALAIIGALIDGWARSNDWRVVEHFSEDWRPDPDYNRDRPRDPFRPYGATPGHGFEWARLIVQLDAALDAAPTWLLPAAEALFERALADTEDGTALVYTTDWDGQPVVADRFHWVLCEAILAADALARATGREVYDRHRTAWWTTAEEHFVDPRGSWHHELDLAMRPADLTWPGKPDAYHVANALIFAELPLAPSAALALSHAAARRGADS